MNYITLQISHHVRNWTRGTEGNERKEKKKGKCWWQKKFSLLLNTTTITAYSVLLKMINNIFINIIWLLPYFTFSHNIVKLLVAPLLFLQSQYYWILTDQKSGKSFVEKIFYVCTGVLGKFKRKLCLLVGNSERELRGKKLLKKKWWRV